MFGVLCPAGDAEFRNWEKQKRAEVEQRRWRIEWEEKKESEEKNEERFLKRVKENKEAEVDGKTNKRRGESELKET